MSSNCLAWCGGDRCLGSALTLTYAWLKAGHLIFVIFWIAGLFMLPRFYVYHQEISAGLRRGERWVERERKLRRSSSRRR